MPIASPLSALHGNNRQFGEQKKKSPKLKHRSFPPYSGALLFPILHSRAYFYTYPPLFLPFRCLIHGTQYCYKSKKIEAWTKVIVILLQRSQAALRFFTKFCHLKSLPQFQSEKSFGCVIVAQQSS